MNRRQELLPGLILLDAPEDSLLRPRLGLMLISSRLPDGWRVLAPHEDLPQYRPQSRTEEELG